MHFILSGLCRLMRTHSRSLAWLSVLILLPPGLDAATSEQAEIVAKPIHVEHRIFNRAHPPRDMPPIKDNEAALCYYQFGCEADCQMESARTLFKLKPARITKVKLTLSLDVTVWLPENDNAKMRAHEEGHREIAETIYRDAPEIARKWGNRAVGITLQSSLKDEAAAQAELKKIQQELMAAYMQETAKRCDRAQVYFDSITAHGLNNLAEKAAVEKALVLETSALHVNTGE